MHRRLILLEEQLFVKTFYLIIVVSYCVEIALTGLRQKRVDHKSPPFKKTDSLTPCEPKPDEPDNYLHKAILKVHLTPDKTRQAGAIIWRPCLPAALSSEMQLKHHYLYLRFYARCP